DAAARAAASETPSPAASARAVTERTRNIEFAYAYPAAAAAIPELVVELEADLARQRRELARIAPRPEDGERPTLCQISAVGRGHRTAWLAEPLCRSLC
ncbi:MAG: hypothetical protein ACK442_13730, partial [Novosphingobium sp.]